MATTFPSSNICLAMLDNSLSCVSRDGVVSDARWANTRTCASSQNSEVRSLSCSAVVNF